MTATAAWSVNHRAAKTVCRHALDATDARYLFEVLGLVAEDGDELLPDDTQLITKELLDVELGAARPPQVVRQPPPRRSTVPEGLRNLPSTPEKKAKPMQHQPPPPSRLEVLEDRLTGAGVIRRDDTTPPTAPPAPGQPARVAVAAGPYVMPLQALELFVDESYQRPLDKARVRKMAAAWNPRQTGVIDVSDRGAGRRRGRYAIINGQHRWASAVQHSPLGDEVWLVCNVHEGLTPADEAKLMFDLDQGTKQLASWDKWKARRAAGDPVVAGVEEVAARHGLRIRPDATDGSVGASGAAERLWRTGGAELLNAVLTVLVSAYGKTNAAFKAPVLTGLGALLQTHAEDVDAERLVLALARTTPQQLRAQADGFRQVEGLSLSAAMTYTITAQYNRAPGRGPRLAGGRS